MIIIVYLHREQKGIPLITIPTPYIVGLDVVEAKGLLVARHELVCEGRFLGV